jgi:uncharacterized Rmd1/YagE family protein
MDDNPIVPACSLPQRRQPARALRFGGRLKLVGVEEDFADLEVLDRSPLVLRLEGGGVAALFPYGTIVFVGSSAAEQQGLLNRLADRIEDRLDTSATIESEIEYGTSVKFAGDCITIKGEALSSLVAVADALAKNVAITFEEAEVKKLLFALEPFTGDLADSGRLPFNRRRMLRTVGEVFRTHRRLLERVDVEEKPDLPKEHGESDHLWERLAEAYHLRKRSRSVSNKLDVIEVMMNGLTELINAQRALRVELLIVLLIATEIAIWIYESFIQG